MASKGRGKKKTSKVSKNETCGVSDDVIVPSVEEEVYLADEAPVRVRGKPVEDDEKTKSYKRAVIRRLLREFDLEETLDRYRNDSAKTYTIDEKEFSSDW